METNPEVIKTLNGLIQTCKVGEEGFQAAAVGISDSTVRKVFLEYSQVRSMFANELQKIIRKIGGVPETAEGVAAASRRGWENIKSAVPGNNEEAVLDECLLAEDAAVERYWAALETLLPQRVSSLVQAQYDQICESKDFVLNLKLKTRFPPPV